MTKGDLKDEPELNPMDNTPACFVLAFPLAKAYDSGATTGVGIDTLGSAQHLVLSIDFSAQASALRLPGNVTHNADNHYLGTTEEFRTESGWECLVIADTSRVVRSVFGQITATV